MSGYVAMSSAERINLYISQLRGEIHECISHIACSDLLALEESLWKQEMLLSTLRTCLRGECLPVEDSQVKETMRRMAGALVAANQSYSELLQQVERDNQRLLSLSLEYTGAAQATGSRNGQHCLEV